MIFIALATLEAGILMENLVPLVSLVPDLYTCPLEVTILASEPALINVT